MEVVVDGGDVAVGDGDLVDAGAGEGPALRVGLLGGGWERGLRVVGRGGGTIFLELPLGWI